MTGEPYDYDSDIAVVGMSGRFPQAADVESLWRVCQDGLIGISRWEGDGTAGRVSAGGLLEGQELFDAAAFGVSPTEAGLLDPQHRVFLEICWEALEEAAVVPDDELLVSVYAAAAPSSYRPSLPGASENERYRQMIANQPDYLATRVSHLLDLQGEAVNVQTACSSSLVAVHLACQSLRTGNSDVALAGGVSIDVNLDQGYAYEADLVASPDGYCRPFDASARGAVPGNGAAVVVLQRLGDAVARGRRVHAVIRSTASNNDGRAKSSFMAPRADGQSKVIATALAAAGIPADSIGYIETHGTGTRLGDSIEIAAARTAFGLFTDRRGFCALGALKANVGHLDRAAGVTGLVKAVCAVRDGVIPPLVGFERPIRDLELDDSPFRAPVAAEQWSSTGPRRAGVSAFGIGGTNAHAIVEEFRPGKERPRRSPDAAGATAFPLSAHDPRVLESWGADLALHLVDGANPRQVAHTLGGGRRDRPVRAVVVADGAADAAKSLRDLPAPAEAPTVSGPIGFLFPDGAAGAQGLALLADRYPAFRSEIAAFAALCGSPATELLEAAVGPDAEWSARVAVQVALARTAEQLGVTADVLCGSGAGEYTAAHLAGVFDRAGLVSVLTLADRMRRAGRPAHPSDEAEFGAAVRAAAIGRTDRQMVSGLTRSLVDGHVLGDPGHWIRHLHAPVADAREVAAQAVGPGGQAVVLGPVPGADALTAFLTALGQLWCAGSPVRWDAANGSADAGFTPLPPYPFDRSRFWNHQQGGVDPAAPARSPRLDTPGWKPAPLARAGLRRAAGRRVVVHGDVPLGHALAKRLVEAGAEVLVTTGRELPPDSEAILVDVTLTGPNAHRANESAEGEEVETWLERGLMGPLRPLRQLRPAHCLVVTRGLLPVAVHDDADPELSAAVGLLRCAPHDLPGLTTGLVDLDPAAADLDGEAAALLAEVLCEDENDIAHRDGVRYERVHRPVTQTRSASSLRRGGVYLVLGGTGRLGAVVAEAISREVAATVVLTGRSPDRPLEAHQRALIEAARARGCTVLWRSLDCTDPAALRAAFDDLAGAQGRVDGIFHLAAHTEKADFDLLGDLTSASAARAARAKVRTADLLVHELADRDYDFVALFSSLSTVIGALRFGAYVSSCAYLDALAVRMRERQGKPWVSLQWDGWTEDGTESEKGLSSEEGSALLLRALRADMPVVAPVVQPTDRRLASVRADLAAVTRYQGQAAGAADSGVSGLERVVATIAEVTGHEGVDPDRSFAALGIDSLQMMKIAARLRPLMKESVSLGTLLRARSVAEAAELVGDGPQETAAEEPAVASVRVGADALSTPQQRLWYLNQLDPDSDSYNFPFGWVLPADVTVEEARSAVLGVIDRHEMLRSAYRPGADGQPGRVTLTARDVPIAEVQAEPDAPDFVSETVREFIGRPFDLNRGSSRVLLVTGHDQPRVVFVCHHLTVDAWSTGIIRDDLLRSLSGEELPDRPAPLPYHHFVQWEHDQRTGAHYRRQEDFWRDCLGDLRPTVPPADAGASTSESGKMGEMTRQLPLRLLRDLRDVAQAEGVTLYAACLTGLSFALGRWCGTPEIALATNLANRSRREFEDIVGMFVDPVVLRLESGAGNDGATLGDALTGVQNRLASAMANSDIPYLDVVGLSGRSEGSTSNPLFSVIATMFDTEADGAGLEPWDLPQPTSSKFPLAVEFLPNAEGLLLQFLYDADRYGPATLNRCLDRIVRFFELLTREGPEASLTELAAAEAPAPLKERFALRVQPVRADGEGSR